MTELGRIFIAGMVKGPPDEAKVGRPLKRLNRQEAEALVEQLVGSYVAIVVHPSDGSTEEQIRHEIDDWITLMTGQIKGFKAG